MAVMTPVYWVNYGPSNFLYFCDLALLLTLVGMWRESPLLIGIPAVGILLPQVLWCVEFVTGMFGWFPIGGMTRYMFADTSLFLRGLSLFHGWLPWLLLWLVLRVGYDRRSFAVWWAVSWAAMLVCFFCMPKVQDPEHPLRAWNINYVYGMGEEPQTFMPEWAWLVVMLLAVPLVLALPTHLVLRRWVRKP
jgi:hypothetical protein